MSRSTRSSIRKRTIYFRDSELWNRAMRAAGERGMSRLIHHAVAAYLDRLNEGYGSPWVSSNDYPGHPTNRKERIELWVKGEESHQYRIAFTGGLLLAKT